MSNSNEPRDLNRDPISGTPGSHPVGVGLGGASGAAAGAIIGAIAGPIGMLVGGGVGAIAGAAAGKGIAERIDPTGESEYWQSAHAERPYYDAKYDYAADYAPAYAYGAEARSRLNDRPWDPSIEAELERDWASTRNQSRLDWAEAKPAVRDAWDRTERTYRTYDAADRYYESRFDEATYREKDVGYNDYRPAYRYGVQARHQAAGREWDDKLENELGRGWDKVKGQSRLGWDKAKAATKDAWHSVERALPGDADRDGR